MSTEQENQGRCSNHALFYHVLNVNLIVRLWIKIKLRYQDYFLGASVFNMPFEPNIYLNFFRLFL